MTPERPSGERDLIIAANWKMNDIPDGALDDGSPYRNPDASDVTVVVFPKVQHIQECVKARLICGGQGGNPLESGAFTGDISMHDFQELGAQYVLCGHSERRQTRGETDAYVAEQAETAVDDLGLTAIVCIGETQKERDTNRTKEVLKRQLEKILTNQAIIRNLAKLIIAYEPVWSIGSGKVLDPEDAQETLTDLQTIIQGFLKGKTSTIPILFGGSVTDENAAELLAKTTYSGFLVGGASLKPDKFAGIVDAALASSPS